MILSCQKKELAYMYETILVVRYRIKLLLDKYGLGERPDVAHISLSWVTYFRSQRDFSEPRSRQPSPASRRPGTTPQVSVASASCWWRHWYCRLAGVFCCRLLQISCWDCEILDWRVQKIPVSFIHFHQIRLWRRYVEQLNKLLPRIAIIVKGNKRVYN